MAAPSFSSFPDLDPGPSSRPEASQKSSKRRRERDAEHERHKDKDKDKDEDKHKRKRHSSHRDSDHKERHGTSGKDRTRRDKDKDRLHNRKRDRDRERAREPGPAAVSSSLYISDRRGDQFNITYGGIHASSVPRYYRRSKGVVGLPGAFRIASDKGKGVEIGLLGRRRARRYTDHHAAAVLRASRVQRLKPTDRPFPRESEDQGFIPLSRSRRRKEPHASSFRELLADDEQASSSSSSESESSQEDSEDGDFVASLTAEQEAIKSLEQSLARDPSSLSSWLSLLSYSLAAIPDDSKNVLKARAEITLSVFSRSLKAHESNGRSARFRVTYLRAGESVWSAEQLHHEWEDALRAVSDKPQIWLTWFTWRLTARTRSGDISGVADDASRAMHALAHSEVARVGILWRSAMFFKEAGYHERATAVLQAQVELSLFCPQSILGAAFESQLPSLEEFWDSEVPRVGEAHARGWAASMSRASPDLPSAHAPDPTVPSQTSVPSDPYHRWYEDERRRDAEGHLPLRTSAGSDDPYATVLFSDIRSFLSPVRSQEGTAWLRYAWLSLSGLHIPGLSAAFDRMLAGDAANHMDVAEPSDSWMLPYDDQFLNKLFPSSLRHVDVDCDVVAGVIVAKEAPPSPVFGPVKEWVWRALHPLEGTGPRGEGRMWELHDVDGLDHGLIRRFFEQTQTAVHDDEWAILSIAFEAAISPKNAGRLSKALLARSPHSLSLWRAHARLERIRGRNDEARKVYTANLAQSGARSVSSQSQPAARAGEAQMWWDWAQMEWLDGNTDASLKAIYTACAVELSGGVSALKAKRALDDRITLPQGSQDPLDERAWICLRALFELLTTGSVTAALSAFSQQHGEHGRSDAGREALEIASLLLVYHHAHTLRVPCPPAVLRERAEAALQLYPENSVVLGVFLEAERGQSIWGRVRKLYGESTAAAGRQKRLIRRLWDIWAAGRERGHYDGERVRQVLSVAAVQYRSVASPLLWKIFTELEIRLSSVSRGKNLVFRGTGECPWLLIPLADLYLLAYGPLRRAFSSDELNRWMESMAERSVRIRQDIELYLQGYKGSRSDDETDSDAADSDIEHNAQELRRLMPY
ncbi:DUF1740-domain-containing protein [Auricularia subglabra TFB-10046 SS5]|nr:DUF1740-domain-containing protein [Auricularia subglabra TFB-10046 SS5]